MTSKKTYFAGFFTAIGIVLIIGMIYIGIQSVLNIIEVQGIQVKQVPYDDVEEKISDIINFISDNYYETYEEEALFEKAYAGLVDGIGDPYTTYYTKEETIDFFENISGSYEGIGVMVSYGETKEEIYVVSPFEGSPGQKAGLLPGDRIMAVDQVEVSGMALEAVVALIKGEKGTEVILSILRAQESSWIDIPITRDVIDVPTVAHEVIEEELGYIKLTGFDSVTYEQFMEALTELEQQNIKGLIIDVRNNPGGLLHIVGAIADELLPAGLIVYTEDKHGKREVMKSDEEKQYDKPIVVLINGNSASASEILAGALSDHKRATLVGTKTFGKGLVQQTFQLKDGSSVKITTARYYTPDGDYIQDVGISPDIEVVLPDELKDKFTLEREEDIQLDKAIEVLKEMAQ